MLRSEFGPGEEKAECGGNQEQKAGELPGTNPALFLLETGPRGALARCGGGIIPKTRGPECCSVEIHSSFSRRFQLVQTLALTPVERESIQHSGKTLTVAVTVTVAIVSISQMPETVHP